MRPSRTVGLERRRRPGLERVRRLHVVVAVDQDRRRVVAAERAARRRRAGCPASARPRPSRPRRRRARTPTRPRAEVGGIAAAGRDRGDAQELEELLQERARRAPVSFRLDVGRARPGPFAWTIPPPRSRPAPAPRHRAARRRRAGPGARARAWAAACRRARASPSRCSRCSRPRSGSCARAPSGAALRPARRRRRPRARAGRRRRALRAARGARRRSCPRAASRTARGSTRAPHLVGERARALDALAARRHRRRLGGGPRRARAARRRARRRRSSWPSATRSSATTCSQRLVGRGLRARRPRSRSAASLAARGDIVDVFPTTGRDAAALRAVRRRGRAHLALLGLHPALAARLSRRRDLPGAEGPPEARPARPGRRGRQRRRVPRGLVSLGPELLRRRRARRLAAGRAARRGRVVSARTPGRRCRRAQRERAYVKLSRRRGADRHWRRALDPLPPGAVHVRGAAPGAGRPRPRGGRERAARPRRRRPARARRLPAPRRRRAHARCSCGASSPRCSSRARGCPPSPASSSSVSPLRRGVVVPRPRPGGAALGRRSSAARAAGGERRSASAAPRDRSPTCGPATTSCTRTTASARFAGFDTKTVADVTRDYLELEFKGEDRIFLPHEQIAKVCALHRRRRAARRCSRKLGGKAWHALKARARHARARAGRRAARALRRPPDARARADRYGDDELMRRLEARLPVRRDRRPGARHRGGEGRPRRRRPMDRLICGDVGFGKTEVAIRAAVKVVTVGPPGADAGADDDPRPAARRRPSATASATSRCEVELVSRLRARADTARALIAGFRGGQGRHPHRHAPRALARRRAERPRPRARRRGAALRRRAEGAAAPAAHSRSTCSRCRPRRSRARCTCRSPGLRDISVIATPPRGRRPIRTHVGEYDEEHRARGAAARARRAAASPSTCTTASSRSTRRPRRCARWCPSCASRVGPRPDGRSASSSR